MLYVISNPGPVANEASLINQLFDEGLAVFHLRKPHDSFKDVIQLLQDINPSYYPKIALHQHHSASPYFAITRLHYTEAMRKKVDQESLSRRKAKYILSTSVHSLADYQSLPEYFDYAFLGPVFNSISKPGYMAQNFEVNQLNKKKDTKLIALGGIDEFNFHHTYGMGYDGIALLGAVWNKEDQLRTFKTIQSKCYTSGQSC